MRKILLILAIFVSFSGTAQNSKYYPIIMMMGQSSYDPDAQAFITAAGITDATQKTAVNQLVLDLKAYSLWTKFTAIYPMVGGTATTHKYNLKNPLDTDGAYRLTFAGGWTHSSTGAQPNGTTGYADTHHLPKSPDMSELSSTIGVYVRTAQAANAVPIGSWDGAIAIYQLNVSTGSGCYYANPTTTSLLNVGLADSKGFFVGTTRSGTDREVYRNSTSIITSAVSDSGTPSPYSFYLGARNQSGGGGGFFSSQELCFAFIASAFSDTEESNLYTAVQSYNTTLSRQI